MREVKQQSSPYELSIEPDLATHRGNAPDLSSISYRAQFARKIFRRRLLPDNDFFLLTIFFNFPPPPFIAAEPLKKIGREVLESAGRRKFTWESGGDGTISENRRIGRISGTLINTSPAYCSLERTQFARLSERATS